MSSMLGKQKLDKNRCDVCNKKIAPKIRKFKQGSLEGKYVKCTGCETVYPVSMTDAEIRDIDKQLDELREATFGTDLDIHQKEKNTRQILYLNNDRKRKQSQLIQSNKQLFLKYGERVKVV